MKLLKVRSTRVERRKQEENITWNKDKVLLFYRYDKEKKNNSSYKEDMSWDHTAVFNETRGLNET